MEVLLCTETKYCFVANSCFPGIDEFIQPCISSLVGKNYVDLITLLLRDDHLQR